MEYWSDGPTIPIFARRFGNARTIFVDWRGWAGDGVGAGGGSERGGVFNWTGAGTAVAAAARSRGHTGFSETDSVDGSAGGGRRGGRQTPFRRDRGVFVLPVCEESYDDRVGDGRRGRG